MHAFRPCFLSVALLVAGLAAQTGAAPLNDNFGDATQLTGMTISTAGSNVGATSEVGEPNHAGFAARKSVWWKWSPPLPRAVVEINTIGSSFDTLLAVYVQFGEGVSDLFPVAFDDEKGGNHTSKLRLITGSQPDRIYYIAVDGFLGASGTIALNFVPDPPPGNDNFASAFLISGLTNSVTGHNTNATFEVGEPPHGGNPYSRSVWWRWTPTTNWVVLLDNTGSSFSPFLDVYRGTTVSSLTPVASSSSGRLTFLPQIGTTYRISADGYYGDFGRITLNLRASPPPANDAFAGAFTINGLTNTVTGDNTFATRETSEPNHAGSTGGKSVWWRWTAPTNWAVVIDSFGSSMSPALGVYTGTSVGALQTAATGLFSEVTFTPTAGTVYRIAVDSFSPDQSGPVTLNLRALPPPTNDNFSAAATIVGTTAQVQGFLLGGRLEGSEPAHGEDKASVWYRWRAPRNGRVRLWSSEHVAAYTGTALSTLTLVSRDTPGNFNFVDVFDAVTGTAYYIAVTGPQSEQRAFDLRLNYAPLNDDFAAAIPLPNVANSVIGSTIGASSEWGEPRVDERVGGKSVWWRFDAPANGSIDINIAGAATWPAFWIYEGANVSNLTMRASNLVPGTPNLLRCEMSCNVLAGHSYYITATGIETNFTFDLAFSFAAPNDAFAGRMNIEPSAAVAFGSTIGASREVGEPWTGSNSVWWSWTPAYAGPVILTTYGSGCDTMLGVYVGNTLTSLSQVATNDDCFVWTTNNAALSGWTTTNGPNNDVISRVRLNADNGVQYKIAVSVATNEPGEVALNITRLAIDDIIAAHRFTNADRSVQFDANLRLVNLQTNASAPLRVRLIARAGYSYRQKDNYNCWTANFNAADVSLGTFALPAAGNVPASGATQIIVNGICPPPFEYTQPNRGDGADWGYGYGVIGVLEEQQGTTWAFRDARMILIGEWPAIGPVQGPGGGVILVSAALQGGNQVGFLDVRIGPPSAVRLNGAWRVSPTNYGELGELRPYTNYTGSNLRLAIRSTNFSIETRPLNGFFSPPNQSISIQPTAIVPLELAYSVHPPLLTFDRLRGLGISGTPQTAYRVLQVTNLPASTWFAYTNLTLGVGTNWLPQTTNTFSNRFYRAFWLPN